MLLTLHEFLAGVLRGIGLLGLSVAAGGIVWGFAVLRAPRRGDLPCTVVTRCLAVVALGSVVLALAQAAALLLENHVLSVTLGRSALPGLASTAHFTAGVARAVLAVALAVTAMRLFATPHAVAGWVVAGVLSALVVTSGAWLTHGAGRMEHRGPLMLLTLAHQLAAIVWVGGLVQLAMLWHLGRRDPRAAAAWPTLVRRFSTLAGAAVAVLVLSALPLVFAYSGNWPALLGTGYGSLVVTKAALLIAVLSLALLARRTIHVGDVAG